MGLADGKGRITILLFHYRLALFNSNRKYRE